METSAAAVAPAGVELALLGLLRGRPMHAYEMHQQLVQAEALGLVWHLKQGHLYALLARLEAAGLIAATTEVQGTRPPRRMLALTPAGRESFAAWLAAPVAHGRDFRLEFLAKLYFAAREGPAAVRALVAGQRDACAGLLAELREQVRAVAAERPYDALVLEFRAGQMEAILPWLGRCEAVLAASPAQP